jgi:FkbM family methyltransferase
VQIESFEVKLMIKTAMNLINRFPIFQKPAYWLYIFARYMRNVFLGTGVRRFGLVPKRMSDRGQDRWIIDDVFRGKKGGYFIELGACDGFSDSNTYVLEKHFDWQGLLIEPNPAEFKKITETYRRTSTPVQLAVDPDGGQLEFLIDGQMSGLLVEEADNSRERRAEKIEGARKGGRVLVVEAVPLEEVFKRYNTPKVIDYMSLDVEGSETRIMRNFPFDQYVFLAMTIERPTPELNNILFSNGYHFVKNSLYDTFYIHESNPNFDTIKKDPFEQIPSKEF